MPFLHLTLHHAADKRAVPAGCAEQRGQDSAPLKAVPETISPLSPTLLLLPPHAWDPLPSRTSIGLARPGPSAGSDAGERQWQAAQSRRVSGPVLREVGGMGRAAGCVEGRRGAGKGCVRTRLGQDTTGPAGPTSAPSAWDSGLQGLRGQQSRGAEGGETRRSPGRPTTWATPITGVGGCDLGPVSLRIPHPATTAPGRLKCSCSAGPNPTPGQRGLADYVAPASPRRVGLPHGASPLGCAHRRPRYLGDGPAAQSREHQGPRFPRSPRSTRIQRFSVQCRTETTGLKALLIKECTRPAANRDRSLRPRRGLSGREPAPRLSCRLGPGANQSQSPGTPLLEHQPIGAAAGPS